MTLARIGEIIMLNIRMSHNLHAMAKLKFLVIRYGQAYSFNFFNILIERFLTLFFSFLQKEEQCL
jgi:hypothetical protein